MRSCHRFFVAVALFGGCALTANAQFITNDTSFPGPHLDLVMSGPGPVYSGYGVALTGMDLSNFDTSVSLPSGTNKSVTTNFNFLGTMTVLGPISGVGTAKMKITDIGGGVYDTEMLALDLTGLGAGHALHFSETTTGIGQETVVPQGGGLFKITSFFDVFTELSIDAGPFALAQDQNNPTHFNLQPPAGTPEPFTIALGIAGVGLAIRRRMKAKA